jgi:glycine hydroxymethyltransferase
MELAHIAANKNTVPGDVSAMVPGGIRMGKTMSLRSESIEGRLFLVRVSFLIFPRKAT